MTLTTEAIANVQRPRLFGYITPVQSRRLLTCACTQKRTLYATVMYVWLFAITSLTRLGLARPNGCEVTEDELTCRDLNIEEKLPIDFPNNITKISFYDCAIPTVPVFSNFTSLHTLWLNNSGVHHIHPQAFAGLEGLKVLRLHDNFLQEVPAFDNLNLEQLHLDSNLLKTIPRLHLPKLKALWLKNNNLTGLPELDTPDLELLYAENNEIVGWKPPVLEHLRQLALDSNRMVGFDGVLNFPKLEMLWLKHNQLREVPGMNLPSLKQLYLENNLIEEVSVGFDSMVNLEQLALDHNRIAEVINGSLAALTSLRTLWLKNNHLSKIPADLRHLTSLQLLYLENNDIERVGFGAIRSKSLQQLALDNNQIREIEAGALHFPTLEKLWLDHNHIQRTPSLDSQRLQYLLLSHNSIQRVDLPELPELIWLDMSWNEIGVVPRRVLEGLPKLQTLQLSHNAISHLDGSQNLHKLVEARISYNSLINIDFSGFEGLKELEILDMGNNNLTVLPSSFLKVSRRLKEIYFNYNEIAVMDFDFEYFLFTHQSLDRVYLNNNDWDCTAVENFIDNLGNYPISIDNTTEFTRNYHGISCMEQSVQDDFSYFEESRIYTVFHFNSV